MKHVLTLLSIFFIINTSYAQAPQGIPYQAAARSSTGAVLGSTPISVRFTIRDSIATGAMKYRETHTVTTDANGMFSLVIGQGTPISGTFTAINWGQNAKFQQVEMDPAGGSSFTDMGTQQMLSVPYSIYSKNGLPVGVGGDILYHDGTNWVKLPAGTVGQVLTMGNSGVPVWANNTDTTSSLAIGSSYGGGKIFYILQPGDPGYVEGQTKGLIAAPNDQSSGAQWGCYGTFVGGTSALLGSGFSNSSIVSAACGTGTAARICADLVLGGYSDWYLPSLNEMNLLYSNRTIVGGFSTGRYWTSSEDAALGSWNFYFNLGLSYSDSKFGISNVRAIRSFSCSEPPNSITGTASVTVGATTTLSSTTTGGTWSSSNTAVATVSSGGIVNGLAAGTATISYTVTSACGSASAFTVVTVTPLAIGMSYGGGKIFYILQPLDVGFVAGQTKGLIAATDDQTSGVIWGCYGSLVEGTSTALGTGVTNTDIVSTACGAGTAARLCADLELGGYSDWYLPSRDELIKLNLNSLSIGGFDSSGGGYWSSSEDGAHAAIAFGFIFGNNYAAAKNSTRRVRAIRSFGCPETPNVITGTASVAVSAITTLSTTTTGGTWSSSNAAIATVSSGGIVNGLAAGTATISYTVINGCGSVSVTRVVTVMPLAIGTSYGGGIIAYIYVPGDPGYVSGETHGLISAPSDQSTGIVWGCYGITVGGTLNALGTGASNTAIVSSGCGAGTAARLCADLVLNGYSDWYLPSINELQNLYFNRSSIGGFTTGYYWSSSEITHTNTWNLFFGSGSSYNYFKTNSGYVRAIRSF